MKQHVLLITGTPGIGKTTLIRKVAEALSDHRLAGFYTEEIRKGGERQGFRLVNFTGEEGVIAHVDFNHRFAVGRYGVDVVAIDRFAESALAVVEGVELYVIDEIGKMESQSRRFTQAVRTLLSTDKQLIATVSKKGGGLIEEVKRCSACELWEVTRGNRDALAADIVAWARERLVFKHTSG